MRYGTFMLALSLFQLAGPTRVEAHAAVPADCPVVSMIVYVPPFEPKPEPRRGTR